MKLTIEHLAGYLPYKLPFIYDFSQGNNRYTGTVIMNGISNHGEDHLFIDYSGGLMHVKHCKLILHPLSDLTKEIEVNGEKVVPIGILSMFTSLEYNEGELFEANSNGEMCETEVLHLSYCQIKELFEWHFDIHGLIESGLAININEL